MHAPSLDRSTPLIGRGGLEADLADGKRTRTRDSRGRRPSLRRPSGRPDRLRATRAADPAVHARSRWRSTAVNRALRAATLGVLLFSPVALTACSAGQVT